MDVSHAQAGKLLVNALALRGVYGKLLNQGGSRREASEESAEYVGVAADTIKQWELEYRTKGHIVVSQMCHAAVGNAQRSGDRNMYSSILL